MPRKPKNPHQLRTVREAAGLTQKELAVRVGLSVSMVQKMERGDLDMNEAIAVKISHQLGCQITREIVLESKKEQISVSSSILDEAGSAHPYGLQDFIEHQAYLKQLPVEYPFGWARGLVYSLRLVLLAANSAGRGPALASDIEKVISKIITKYKLQPHLTTLLGDVLNIKPDDAKAKAKYITEMPIEAGCSLLDHGLQAMDSGFGDSNDVEDPSPTVKRN